MLKKDPIRTIEYKTIKETAKKYNSAENSKHNISLQEYKETN